MEQFSIWNNKFYSFNKIKEIDPILSILILSLSIIGFIMLYSAGGGNLHPWAASQIIRFLFFIPIMLILISLDIRIIHKLAYLGYFIALSLLIASQFFGHTAMGATRWLKIGFINTQPSEFMKICLIIALAKYFHNTHIYKVKSLYFLLFPIIITAIPVILILKQPDLGTSFILSVTAISIFFAAGVNKRKFIIASIGATAMIPLIWNALKEYQKQRVLTFINPNNDPLGSGYNIIQSKIAIGS